MDTYTPGANARSRHLRIQIGNRTFANGLNQLNRSMASQGQATFSSTPEANPVTRTFTRGVSDWEHNTRFYGNSDDRGAHTRQLRDDEKAQLNIAGPNSKRFDYGKNTVDYLNSNIGLYFNNFNPYRIGMDGFRRRLIEIIYKAKINPKLTDEERAWAAWLYEGSRLRALQMRELSADWVIKNYNLDATIPSELAETDTSEDDKESTDNPSELVETYDDEQKRIYLKDPTKADSMSHYINSGVTRKVRGEDYTVYWAQDGYKQDIVTNEKRLVLTNYAWSDEMKTIFGRMVTHGVDEGGEKNFRAAVEKKLKPKFFGAFHKKYKKNAQSFSDSIMSSLQAFYNGGPFATRFWRLTSLMGLDFYNHQGKTVNFTRNIGQKAFTGGGSRRVITDSEWAHSQRMNYLGNNVQMMPTSVQFRSDVSALQQQ